MRTLLLLLSIAWCSSALPGWSQTITGSIAGVVTDTSGAVFPQVAVTATNISTGIASSTTTDPSGHYQFLSLPAGTYTLSAAHAGFATAKIASIPLRLYQQLVQNFVMEVGKAQQTVTVQGAATLVDTTSASLGTTIGTTAILDLPLDLREVGALALLVPGTVNTTGNTAATALGDGGGFNDYAYSGSGGGSGGNLLLIDGMLSLDMNNSSFALQLPPEMVQEFKIQNNIYDASFGLANGTVMNLITVSGANAIHGSGWEYNRDAVLAATDYFAITKPALSRNQFGGVFGGPIIKDKAFYFGGYEGLRLTQGSVLNSVVPTAAERTGDFSSFLTGTTANLCAASGAAAPPNLNYDTGQLFDPASESTYTCPANPGGGPTTTVLVGTPIPGNMITAFDPTASKVLALFPAPTRPGTVNYTNEQPETRQNDIFDGRVDYTLNKSNTLFARYVLGNSNQITPETLPTFAFSQHFRGQNLVGGWTKVLGPSAINNVRIGRQTDYLDLTCLGCPRAPGTIASFGVTNLAAPTPAFEQYPGFLLTNFAPWGDGFPGYLPDILPDSIEQYSDTFTKVLGRHTLAVGSHWYPYSINGLTSPPHVNGTFQFNGQFSSLAGEIPGVSTVSDLADMELGYPDYALYTKNAIFVDLFGGRLIDVFVQDNIRVNSRLTVQAGLRWEYRRPPMEKNNNITALYPLPDGSVVPSSSSFMPGNALVLTSLPDADNDALCSNNPYFLSASGQCLVMNSGVRRAKGFTGNKRRQVTTGPGPGYFAPRFGVSWQPTQSDKLVVHAGVGVFMNVPLTNRLGPAANANPVAVTSPSYNTAFGEPPPLTNGIPTKTQQVFANATTAPLGQAFNIFTVNPIYKTPQTISQSVSLQAQLAKDWGAEVAYVGSESNHLDYIHDLGNQATPGVGPLQPRRIWPDFSGMLFDDNIQGRSNYQSLQAKIEKRASNGLYVLGSYTYARALSNGSGNEDFFISLDQDDNHPNTNWGVDNTNIGQTLVASAVYQLPVGRGKRFLGDSGAFVNTLAGGWEVSGIVFFHSGFPFTVTTTQDYSNSGSPSPRPDQLCSGVGPKKLSEWFNLNCYSTTALAQALAAGHPRFGTTGRNTLFGPGTQNWDLSFMKLIQTGRVTTEFKGEFFNAFNHSNPGAPGSVIGSSTAGVIASDAGPRDIQLGVKVQF